MSTNCLAENFRRTEYTGHELPALQFFSEYPAMGVHLLLRELDNFKECIGKQTILNVDWR